MLSNSLFDYFAGLGLMRVQRPLWRRVILISSFVCNLGMLGFFKYFNFFIDTARPLLEAIGLSGQTLEIILPVGISFYTFQTLSYTIDVYRGVLKPTDRFLDFALYVAFFPQLVAGPIVRARELLPQLGSVPVWSNRRCYGGAQQMLRGAVKKVLLADRLGEAVDVVFAGPELYSGITIWIAVLAYAGQIYYDFSGYSDIAIGAAKMLGYRFPINFRHPYLATSVADFWHRWHMTLSRWLRDYLYISLGGNRAGRLGTYRNLLITMTLGGLWHGAAWTFVLWGLWHGVALVVERAAKDAMTIRPARVIGWTLTLGVVLIGWVLFRSSDLEMAGMILGRMTSLAPGIDWYPPLVIAALGCLVVEHAAWKTKLRRAMRLPAFAWYSPVATTIMLWALLLYAPRGFRPFVYFQF
jgi:alginate O-acetyltransferase complex protein AlgI